MGDWDMEDVHLGESLHGMQTDMGGNVEIGALQQLNKLRSQLGLGPVAAQRFNPHAPLQRTIRSPYADSTQIGIECTGIFTPTNWLSSVKPQVFGTTRVYQSFKPMKAIVTEHLIVTFTNDTLGEDVRAIEVPNAGDVLLVQAFAGSYNCFPNAPNQQNGISGATFASNSLGNGISWPTLNPGIDVNVAFAINRSAIYQVQPPTGYVVADITSIEIEVRMNLLGRSLR